MRHPGPMVDSRPTWFCRLDELREDDEWRIWDDETWGSDPSDGLGPKAWVQVRKTDPYISIDGAPGLLRKSQLRRQIATLNSNVLNINNNRVPVDRTTDAVWAWLEERLG